MFLGPKKTSRYELMSQCNVKFDGEIGEMLEKLKEKTGRSAPEIFRRALKNYYLKLFEGEK